METVTTFSNDTFAIVELAPDDYRMAVNMGEDFQKWAVNDDVDVAFEVESLRELRDLLNEVLGDA